MFDPASQICWHERFAVFKLDNSLLLLGDGISYWLDEHSYAAALLQLPAGKVISIDELMQQLPHSMDPMQQAMLLNHISQLIQRKFLRLVAQDKPAHYFSPDYQCDYAKQSYSRHLTVYYLSQCPDIQHFAECLQQLQLCAPINIIIVDDYLDPRLATLLTQLSDYILLKLSGEQTLVGPLLAPGNPLSACWHCLNARLRRNQPVREWLQTKLSQAVLSVPILYSSPLLQANKPLILITLQTMLDSREYNSIVAIQDGNVSVNKHRLQADPYCQHCAPFNIKSGQELSSLAEQYKLQSCFRSAASDGGWRTHTADQTLAALQPFISPITGVIAHLALHASQAQAGINVYRSAFFKIPTQQAILTSNAFLQRSLGKGVSDSQSQVSALCESIERYVAQYDARIAAMNHTARPQFIADAIPVTALTERCFTPDQLAFFSDSQYAQFDQVLATGTPHKQAVKRFTLSTALRWLPAWSLTKQQTVYLPLSYCYNHTPFADESYCRWTSNGNAAGNTREEAVLQGLFEVIERDAIAVWWYNKQSKPVVDIMQLLQSKLQAIQRLLDSQWSYWVLDLTHDIGIPVMAAIAQHNTSGGFSLGFGCHINPVLACERALTELCQLIAVREHGDKDFNFDSIKAEPYLLPNELSSSKHKALDAYYAPDYADIKDAISHCVQAIERVKLEVIVFDYQRADIPLSTVKVIVPGTCHMWPQYGNPRLYASADASADTLNALELYI